LPSENSRGEWGAVDAVLRAKSPKGMGICVGSEEEKHSAQPKRGITLTARKEVKKDECKKRNGT
jgi:hypothetical protein